MLTVANADCALARTGVLVELSSEEPYIGLPDPKLKIKDANLSAPPSARWRWPAAIAMPHSTGSPGGLCRHAILHSLTDDVRS